MRNRITSAYPHFSINEYSIDLYIVDYTNQTQNERSVEIHTSKSSDIDSFYIKNTNGINIGTCIFNKDSFVDSLGNSLTQCECMSFALSNAETKPWVLFIELKYCDYKNAKKKISDAKNQVFATMRYLKENGVVKDKQRCYLVVSLPKQNNTPFENWIMTPAEISSLKLNENIIFRGVNELSIIDEHNIKI